MRIACPELSKIPGVAHGFFTRKGGVSGGIYASLNCGFASGDDVAAVAENRAIVAKTLGAAPENLCTAYQIHSAAAAIIDAPFTRENAPQADALVTAAPGLALGVLAADCLPVLLADGGHRVIAAAHSGWKGAIGGILEATLTAMESLGAKREGIVAAIGPGIAQGSYEVGIEFHARFMKEEPRNQMYFIQGARPGHWLFDLKSYASERLKSAGVSRINILAHDTCVEEDAFFSYRRATLRGEQAYGRLISAIVLEK